MIQSFIPMAYKSIRKWAEDEGPRERVLRHGPPSTSDAQLLEIMLLIGGGSSGALAIGLNLLKTFCSFRELGEVCFPEYSAIKENGRAKAAQTEAAIRKHEPSFKGLAFAAVLDVNNYSSPGMQRLRKEGYYCKLSNVKDRLQA
jgi:DNA repair protein RadC